jgi:argininosuccinate lyase
VTGRPGAGQGRRAPEEPGAGAPSKAAKPTSAPQGAALWHGRFADAPAEALLDFTESLSFDSRLAPDDLAGSRAHVDMLARVGLITEEERSVMGAALTRVEAELAAGTFTFLPLDEDIHTAVERRVTELAGPAGAKLHTGRSRNDQVALDLRLYVRREGRVVGRKLCDLMQVLLRRAAQAHAEDVYLPGYTHMQRAQPVLLAHHLLAHFWALSRDVDRLADALDRADVSPLGAGALAGSTLPLDPAGVAAALGFARPFENSLDAVSDRDFVAELLFVAALAQVHLSRIGEEVVLWATEEFGFLRLADAYSTGSSMLPQKKNPDIAELVRGKAGRLIGNLTGFLATLKGLPLSYNRDLQEDKEPLFDTLDTLVLAASAMAGLLDTSTFDYARMRTAADAPASAAADLAEDMVRAGTPFRDAHALVGKLVRESVERGIPLDELIMTEPKLGPDALAALESGASVRRRTSPGGAGTASVAAQLESARTRLADQEGRLAKGG